MRTHPRIRLQQFLLACAIIGVPAAVGEVRAQTVDSRIAAFERGLRPAADADEAAERWSLEERMVQYGVPGVSVAVIEDGKIAWARGYGVLQAGGSDPVDVETVFSVGSVSKIGTAAATLRLVNAGELDLDRPVNDYLTTWQVPENDLTREAPVTLRRIMSHTAGLTVHGFADFQPGEDLPTTVQILESSGPAKNAPVVVDIPPGSQFRYSGGGVTVEQLVIEETLDTEFDHAVRRLVFEPLGMTRSTYENPIPASHGNIAKAHDGLGRARALPRGYEAMPESGASGLWTSPSDFALLVIALIESHRGAPDAFISAELAHDAMTEVSPGPYGLGPDLVGQGDIRRFIHGGSNNSYKAYMEGHLVTGDGVVVFTNGARGGDLIPEILRSVAEAEGWDDAWYTNR
ncbi:MAG: beta-lactamase family protein [Gemmatimonadota bacterium]|nr:beta-lactamase family protein [Gemmatimonadota bacterium]